MAHRAGWSRQMAPNCGHVAMRVAKRSGMNRVQRLIDASFALHRNIFSAAALNSRIFAVSASTV